MIISRCSFPNCFAGLKNGFVGQPDSTPPRLSSAGEPCGVIAGHAGRAGPSPDTASASPAGASDPRLRARRFTPAGKDRPQARRLNAAGFAFAVVRGGGLLMLLLP